jgi:hypothetical protein
VERARPEEQLGQGGQQARNLSGVDSLGEKRLDCSEEYEPVGGAGMVRDRMGGGTGVRLGREDAQERVPSGEAGQAWEGAGAAPPGPLPRRVLPQRRALRAGIRASL